MTNPDLLPPTLGSLSINGAELAKAVRRAVKVKVKWVAAEISLSYESGELIIEAMGASVTVPATGEWPGTAIVHRDALWSIAELPKGSLTVWFTADGRLHFGSTSFDGRWIDGPRPQIDLDLEPTLLDLLRLRLEHSDEALRTADLLGGVARAERKKERMIEGAATKLKELGDFRAAIARLVADEVHRAR